MPMTVISVSGSVRHIRPLPSDSTTMTVPVSAIAKFAPDTATRARRNFSRRWSRAASARARGSSVRSSGAGRPAAAISRRKISRISERLRWIAGTRMCDGRSWPSWTISSARSVSQAAMPSLRERLVELDLLGRHRLDLDDLVGAGGLHEPGDDRVRLGRVAGPVDLATRGGHVPLQLVEELRQAGEDLVLDRGAGEAELLPVRDLADGPGPLLADRRRRPAEVRPELAVGEGGLRGRRERRRAGEGRRGRVGRRRGAAGGNSRKSVTRRRPRRGSRRGA